MSRRTDRLNEQVKREIADILQTRVKDPRVGSVLVTGARVAPDLSLAQIYVVIKGDPAEQKATIEGLEAAAPFMRSELGSRLSVRKVPQLRFIRDQSFDYANRIEELLHQIKPADTAPTTQQDESDDD
jgi:ribosome-binding factor A